MTTAQLDGAGEWRVPSRDDFARYVETSMADVLGTLERQRRKAVRNTTLGLGITVALAAAAIFVGLTYSADPTILAVFVGIGAMIVAVCAYWLATRAYHRQFKAQLISPLVRFFGPDFQYEADSFIDEGRFVASQIFRTTPDRYKGEDHICGTAGKTRFECSEVHAEEKTETTNSKGHRRTSWSTIFKGLFFIADFNKGFEGSTYVFPDALESTFGWLAQKIQKLSFTAPGELVKLEDPEFEKLFVVYSTDQTLARYILSPSLMKRITEYRRKLGRKVWLSFRDGTLFAAVWTGRNMFEPRVFSPVDLKQCMLTFDDLQLTLGIIEDLNLNTRIWSKR